MIIRNYEIPWDIIRGVLHDGQLGSSAAKTTTKLVQIANKRTTMDGIQGGFSSEPPAKESRPIQQQLQIQPKTKTCSYQGFN